MGERAKTEKRRVQLRDHVARMRGQERDENIACSFCMKREGEVMAIFAAPSAAYICDQCVIRLGHEVAKRRAFD
jgi:hypothetical protein